MDELENLFFEETGTHLPTIGDDHHGTTTAAPLQVLSLMFSYCFRWEKYD